MWADIVRQNCDLISRGEFNELYGKVPSKDRERLYKMFKDLGINIYKEIRIVKDLWPNLSGKEYFKVLESVVIVGSPTDIPNLDFLYYYAGNAGMDFYNDHYSTFFDGKFCRADVNELNAALAQRGFSPKFHYISKTELALDIKGGYVSLDSRVGDYYVDDTLFEWPCDIFYNAKVEFEWR